MRKLTIRNRRPCVRIRRRSWPSVRSIGIRYSQQVPPPPHTHTINTLSQHTLSTHPIKTISQHTLSTHPIKTISQHTLSTHLINTPHQHTLSTHPIINIHPLTLSLLSSHPPNPPSHLPSQPTFNPPLATHPSQPPSPLTPLPPLHPSLPPPSHPTPHPHPLHPSLPPPLTPPPPLPTPLPTPLSHTRPSCTRRSCKRPRTIRRSRQWFPRSTFTRHRIRPRPLSPQDHGRVFAYGRADWEGGKQRYKG